MRTFIASLLVLTSFTGSLLAAPFTLITGVYRYTPLADGTVSVEGGSLYSSGEYTGSFTFNRTTAELAESGLDAATLSAIAGKFVIGADYIDSELATPEGRERHSNYSFVTSKSYTTDQGRVYLVTAGGFTPDVPTINVSMAKSPIREGGRPSAIILKLNKPASDELIVRFTQGGTAKFKTDYTGPPAKRFVMIPKGKTTFRIPVRPLEDGIKEAAEDFVFRLAKNDGYKIGQKKAATIRIQDND